MFRNGFQYFSGIKGAFQRLGLVQNGFEKSRFSPGKQFPPLDSSLRPFLRVNFDGGSENNISKIYSCLFRNEKRSQSLDSGDFS